MHKVIIDYQRDKYLCLTCHKEISRELVAKCEGRGCDNLICPLDASATRTHQHTTCENCLPQDAYSLIEALTESFADKERKEADGE